TGRWNKMECRRRRPCARRKSRCGNKGDGPRPIIGQPSYCRANERNLVENLNRAMEDAISSGGKSRLTAAQFENLLHRLGANRERAGQAYEYLRRQLIRFFEWNCDIPAEDLVDETFDRVAQKLEELEIHNVVAFAWGVARNIRHEAEKKAARMI